MEESGHPPNDKELPERMFQRVLNLSEKEAFSVLGSPLTLYILDLITQGIANAPRIQAGILSVEDAFWKFSQLGIEFCIISIGVYWAGSYIFPLLERPSGIFLFVVSFLLLLACAFSRNLLFEHPWSDLLISNAIGLISFSFSFLAVLSVEKR